MMIEAEENKDNIPSYDLPLEIKTPEFEEPSVDMMALFDEVNNNVVEDVADNLFSDVFANNVGSVSTSMFATFAPITFNLETHDAEVKLEWQLSEEEASCQQSISRIIFD